MRANSVSTPPDGKKQRAKNRHSKGGCQTCKTRHVKCDERKPTCLKCENAGWKCEGYKSQKENVNCKLAPKKLVWQPRSTFPFPRTIHSSSVPNRFKSEEEYRYFKHFQDSIVIELSGFFDAKLWGSLVLQTCDVESSIRHAATAIGAWNYYKHGWSGTKEQLRGRQFAYQQYSEAIKQIMEATNKGSLSLRTNLLACLLFAYFESLNENEPAAYSQLSCGIKLIEEWHISCSSEFSQGKSHTRTHPSRSPNSAEIEEEILDTFERAELQVNTHCGFKNGPPRSPRAFTTVRLDPLPASFVSLLEARKYLSAIRRKCLFWTRGLYAVNKSNGLTMHQVPENHLQYDDTVLSEYGQMCSESQDIMSIFEQWEHSFQPLWEQSQRSDSLETYLGGISLRLQFLNIYLRQWTCSGDESIYYGRFTPQLTEIVTLSATIMHHCPTYSQRFTFSNDGQIIMPLDTVACCFRDRELRQQAIDMLRSSTRIEGMWRGDLVSKAMQFIQELEETGLADNEKFVPRDRVVKDLTWVIVPEKRVTRVCCLQAVDGEWVNRERVIPWID